MIIKKSIFNTYRLCESSHLTYDVKNTIRKNNKFSFKIAYEENPILIEMSLCCYKSLNCMYLGNNKIELDYYQCELWTNDNFNKKIINGIIISNYDFRRDNILIFKFYNNTSFPDTTFGIYSLESYTTYYTNIFLHNTCPTDSSKNNIIKSVIHKIKISNEFDDYDIFCSETSDDEQATITIDSDTFKPIFRCIDARPKIQIQTKDKCIPIKQINTNIFINIGNIETDLQNKHYEKQKIDLFDL
jgi:hypothetical protein